MAGTGGPKGLRRDALSVLGSVALHGAVFVGILVLLPEALRAPDREHGVEMVWQDEGLDSAAAAAAPAPVPAPPMPEAAPPPPPPQAVAPPPRPVPPPVPTPQPPQQIARVAPPPAPPLAAPPAPPDRAVEVPLPPEAPPPQRPATPEAPPRVAPAPAAPVVDVPLPETPVVEAPPPETPVAEAPAPETPVVEPPPPDAPPPEPMLVETPSEPLQMADPIPLPPPPMPLPLPPLRTADARPVPPRPPAAPMRPMPGIAPLGQAPDGDTQAERVGATRVVGAIVPPGLLDGVRNAQPEYPSSSRLRGEQGVVALVLQVSTSGAVTGVEIGRTSGFPQLDEAAKKAALRWRFRPATRDGVPIEGTIRTQVHFRLVQ